MMTFFSSYILWHYSRALKGIVVLWFDTLWFINHLFSITLLFRTLFTPWRRLRETYQGGFNLENILSLIVVNTLMRIVGAVIRLVIIALGLIVLLLAFIGGILFFIVWLVAPLVIATLLSWGLSLLF